MKKDTAFPYTREALRKLRFSVRAWACELFMSWSVAACPEDYTPSWAEAASDMYKAGKAGLPPSAARRSAVGA